MLNLFSAQHLYLYGDKVYKNTFEMMRAYKKSVRDQLRQNYNIYNAVMSSCQITVEHDFAHVANLWSFNNFKSQMKIDKLSFTFLSLCFAACSAATAQSSLICYRFIAHPSILFSLSHVLQYLKLYWT